VVGLNGLSSWRCWLRASSRSSRRGQVESWALEWSSKAVEFYEGLGAQKLDHLKVFRLSLGRLAGERRAIEIALPGSPTGQMRRRCGVGRRESSRRDRVEPRASGEKYCSLKFVAAEDDPAGSMSRVLR